MANLISNSSVYNIITENELSIILSHYDSEFVLSVVEDAIKKRFVEIPLIPITNVVTAWEANFKAISDVYKDLPDSKSEVSRVRNATYQEIIEKICNSFNLTFTVDQNIDLYSAATVMYDFFVCNFIPYMVTFFSNYIYKEQNNLYDALNMVELKKNKDTSTTYGKKMYKSVKMAVINANLDYVITQISSFDISLQDIVNVSMDPNRASFLNAILSDNNCFYQSAYISLLNNSYMRPSIISEIIFKLHNTCVADKDYLDDSIRPVDLEN